MAKINQKEYEILKSLDDQWKWIARDRALKGSDFSNEIWIFEYEPIRDSHHWIDHRGEAKVLPYDCLFRFIRWEDREPCNIAELIEGYEYSADHVSHVVNERVKALGKAWSESEEKEMKSKQELIEKWESAIESAEFYGKGKEGRLIGYMKDFVSDLNQLDPERSPEVDQHKELLDELNDLYERKNQDYGNSFDESLDEDGLLVLKIRLGDKYKRFSQLISNDQMVGDESMRDTLIDLANYALMGVMWMDSQEEEE